jgi:hypothetical protein
VRKPEGKKPFGRPEHSGVDDNKIVLKKHGGRVSTGLIRLRIGLSNGHLWGMFCPAEEISAFQERHYSMDSGSQLVIMCTKYVDKTY